MKKLFVFVLILLSLSPLFAGPRERDLVYETGRIFFSAYNAKEYPRSGAEAFLESYESLKPAWEEDQYERYLTKLEEAFGRESVALIEKELEKSIRAGNFENVTRSGAIRTAIYEFDRTPLWGEMEADDFKIKYELNGEIKDIEISGSIRFFTWMEDGLIYLGVETEDLESEKKDIGDIEIEISASEDFEKFTCKLGNRELDEEDINDLKPIFSLIEKL